MAGVTACTLAAIRASRAFSTSAGVFNGRAIIGLTRIGLPGCNTMRRYLIHMKGLALILIIAGIAAAWYYLPANHHRAGTGTYFLNQYISFATPHGMTGWAPGQEVHEVLKAPYVQGNKTVSDGTFSAVIPETVLTQDIEDAEALRSADSDSQAQAKSNLAAAKAHAAKQTFTAQLASAQDITRLNAQQVAASTVGAFHSRLNEPARYVGSGSSTIYYGYPVNSVPDTRSRVFGVTSGAPLSQTANGSAWVYKERAAATPPPSVAGLLGTAE